MNAAKTIDVQELKKRRDQNPKLCIIDVREQDEWDEGHIPNALHIPKDSLVSQISKHVPDKHQAVYLHCRRGTRSAMAAGWLAAEGYTEVYTVAGGITDWAEHDYPMVTAKN